jgi:hypothetical protein
MQAVMLMKEEEEKKKCVETGILLTHQLMDFPHTELQWIPAATTALP